MSNSKAEIVIVDYGIANLRSVQKAFEAVGATAEITTDPSRIANAERLVLPGVGAFRDGIAGLRKEGLDVAIESQIRSGRPFLGICLGLQLLFTHGREDGDYTGLNILGGDVVPLTPAPGLKLPHMGWNTLRFTQQDNPLFEGLPPEPSVYFVHGYYAAPTDSSLVAATTDYPNSFCSAIRKDNVFAVQFHPEKSQDVGLRMLKNFTAV